ncbi:hypothetical protein IMCC3088_1718 [Aequoribacter fuscus]|uniref:Uncharacterized protein n=1 Tax=Aequoribacter fuscus TaxID=2518989 RepID=F3L2F1_9GAMM|nr:hypothetical protein IMCC3088_1718 [Aequoribacter fuscus]
MRFAHWFISAVRIEYLPAFIDGNLLKLEAQFGMVLADLTKPTLPCRNHT